MPEAQLLRFDSISAYFRYRGLPPPAHPLVTVVRLDAEAPSYGADPAQVTFGFYAISLKRLPGGSIRYGQHPYDFDDGVLFFLAPGQVLHVQLPADAAHAPSGWILLVHPDFLWGYPLARNIQSFDYFGYAVHEALHLSSREQEVLDRVVQTIEAEYSGNLDRFSHDLIVTQIESLLLYADRFYHRQFLTRRIANHGILERFQEVLEAQVHTGQLLAQGLPTVQSIAGLLALSPNYLSSVLKTVTGRSAQQHIQDRIVALAKEMLSTTRLTVGEIAYELGFEHPQSFSKMFKLHTALSPLQFRACFS